MLNKSVPLKCLKLTLYNTKHKSEYNHNNLRLLSRSSLTSLPNVDQDLVVLDSNRLALLCQIQLLLQALVPLSLSFQALGVKVLLTLVRALKAFAIPGPLGRLTNELALVTRHDLQIGAR